MHFKNTLQSFSITILLSYVINWLLAKLDYFQALNDYTNICLTFFIALMIVFYGLAIVIYLSKKQILFNFMIFFTIFLKMLFCIIFLYYFIQPSDTKATAKVLIFFINYVLFTVFEINFLTKFARSSVKAKL